MDEDHANYSPPPQRQKKPGPRPNPCIWCGEIQCNHCQCTGHPKCDHKAGEPCSRQRYWSWKPVMDRYHRRLVCNPCEKNKLKDETGKKGGSKYLLYLQFYLGLRLVKSLSLPGKKRKASILE